MKIIFTKPCCLLTEKKNFLEISFRGVNRYINSNNNLNYISGKFFTFKNEENTGNLFAKISSNEDKYLKKRKSDEIQDKNQKIINIGNLINCDINRNINYEDPKNRKKIKYLKENIKNKELYEKIGYNIELVKRPNIETLKNDISVNNNNLNTIHLNNLIEIEISKRKSEAKEFIKSLLDSGSEENGISSIMEDQILIRNFKLLIKILIDDFDLFNKLRISLIFLKFKKQHESLFSSLLEGIIQEINILGELNSEEKNKEKIIEKFLLIEKTFKIINKHNLDRDKINFEKVNMLIDAMEKNFKCLDVVFKNNPNEFFSFFNEFTKFENETLKIKDEIIARTNIVYFIITNFTLNNFNLFTIETLIKILDYINKNNHRDTNFLKYIFLYFVKYLKENLQSLKNEKFKEILIYLNFILINNNIFFDSRFSELDDFQKFNFCKENEISNEMSDFYRNRKMRQLNNIKNYSKKDSFENIVVDKLEINNYFYPHLLINDFENSLFFFNTIIKIYFEKINNDSYKNSNSFYNLKVLCFIHDGLLRNFFLEGNIKSENNNNILRYKGVLIEMKEINEKKINFILNDFLLTENKILHILKKEENKIFILNTINLIQKIIKNALDSSNYKTDMNRILEISKLDRENINSNIKREEIKYLGNIIICINYLKSIKNFIELNEEIYKDFLKIDRSIFENTIITNFHKDIIRLLIKLNIKFNVEGKIDEIDKDIEVVYYDKQLKICIELDGYYHFYRDCVMNFKTIFKRKIIERKGWKIISFKYSEWIKISEEEEKLNMLKRKIDFLIDKNEKKFSS